MHYVKITKISSLPTGFEPVRAEPNGFRVHRLNHSATTAVLHFRLSIFILTLDIFFIFFPKQNTVLLLTFCVKKTDETIRRRRRMKRRIRREKLLQEIIHELQVNINLQIINFKRCAVGRIRTCAGRAQWISSPSP